MRNELVHADGMTPSPGRGRRRTGGGGEVQKRARQGASQSPLGPKLAESRKRSKPLHTGACRTLVFERAERFRRPGMNWRGGNQQKGSASG